MREFFMFSKSAPGRWIYNHSYVLLLCQICATSNVPKAYLKNPIWNGVVNNATF